jgi:hypothetical protein
MTDTQAPDRRALSLEDIEARFLAVRETFLGRLDALDAEREERLAGSPDLERAREAGAAQRRTLLALLDHVAKLLVAAAATRDLGGAKGQQQLEALVADLRKLTGELQGSLARRESRESAARE